MTKNGDFSEEKWTNFTLKNTISPLKTAIPLEDLLLGQIDIFDRSRHFSSRDSWFSLYKIEYLKFVSEEAPTPEPEIPLVKRQWSECQQKALQTLIAFGAEELSEFSTDLEIKKAFRSLAKRYHPDTLINQPEAVIREKSQQFIAIHRSYKELIESCGT